MMDQNVIHDMSHQRLVQILLQDMSYNDNKVPKRKMMIAYIFQNDKEFCVHFLINHFLNVSWLGYYLKLYCVY